MLLSERANVVQNHPSFIFLQLAFKRRHGPFALRNVFEKVLIRLGGHLFFVLEIGRLRIEPLSCRAISHAGGTVAHLAVLFVNRFTLADVLGSWLHFLRESGHGKKHEGT